MKQGSRRYRSTSYFDIKHDQIRFEFRTATTVRWNAIGNKIRTSLNLSESLTLEDVEVIEKGTRGNGYQ